MESSIERILGRRNPQLFLLALIFAGLGSASGQTPAVLNLSHDLVANGIASKDMAPNSPSLDSRPLFQAVSPTLSPYRLHVGHILGEVLLVLNGLYSRHPSLRPAGLK